MQCDDRFQGTYLALVALNWEALERVDRLLSDSGSPVTPLIEGHLQWQRLELLQLRESVTRCAASRLLSVEQQRLVQTLISTLLEWLDFDAATATEVVQLRLAAAQDWLLEAAGELIRPGETPELNRQRG